MKNLLKKIQTLTSLLEVQRLKSNVSHQLNYDFLWKQIRKTTVTNMDPFCLARFALST